MSQRRSSQRRYLASLVGTEESTTLLGASKPFSVSLPFTMPRKSASAPSQDTAPYSSSTAVAQERGTNLSIAEPPRPLPPQPPVAAAAAPAVPERRRNGAGGGGCGALGPVTTRKMALQLPETEYDGSEASFVALLMSRLRQQCDALTENADTTLVPRFQSSTPPSAAEASAATTLWEEVEGRNRKTALRSLPVDLLLHVLSYCPVVELCRLSCTARRIHAIVSSSVVWIPICTRFHLRYERIPNTFDFVKDPRVLVREYLVSIRRSLDRQLEEQQTALRDIEQRMNQRAEALAPFSRQLVQEVNGIQQQHPALVQVLERTEQRLNELSQATESWDVLRGTILQSLQENKSILVDNQRILRALWNAVHSETAAVQPAKGSSATFSCVTTGSAPVHGAAPRAPAGRSFLENNGDDTTAGTVRLSHTAPFSAGIPRRPPTEQLGATSSQDVSPSSIVVAAPSHHRLGVSKPSSAQAIDEKQLDKLERRVSRIVLAPCKDLPVIIRRGVNSFSAVELLVSQLLPHPQHVASPSASSPESPSVVTGATLAVRWAKWKQFFPVASIEYADIRDAVAADESAAGISQWPQRLASCAAMIRKVCSLTDEELEAVVFEQS